MEPHPELPRRIIDLLFSEEFKVELRFAKRLRRAREPLHGVELDDLRAEALFRYVEGSRAQGGLFAHQESYLLGAPSLRGLASTAVYHLYCRERRRARSLDQERLEPQAPPGGDDVITPATSVTNLRAAIRNHELPREVVHAARAQATKALHGVSEDAIDGRAGAARNHDLAGRAPGLTRWMIQYERDRHAGALAREMVTRRFDGGSFDPATLLLAVCEGSRSLARPPASIARIAHTAVVNPRSASAAGAPERGAPDKKSQ